MKTRLPSLEYPALAAGLKHRIRRARITAVRAINADESNWQQPVANFQGRLPTARQLAAAVRDVMPTE